MTNENLNKFLKNLIPSNSSSEEEFEKKEFIKSNILSLLENEEIYIDSATEESYNNYSSYYSHSFFMRFRENNFEIIQKIVQVDFNPSQGGKYEEDHEEETKITDDQALFLLKNENKKLKEEECYYCIDDLFIN